MGLPIVTYPTFELTLPMSRKKVKCRPFASREYKWLLQAMETKDSSQFINTMCDIIVACTFEAITLDDFDMSDIDYLFLQIRARSSGELLPIQYVCNATVESNEGEPERCGGKVLVGLNLNELQLIIPEGYEEKKIVTINETTGIKLRSPKFKFFREMKAMTDLNSVFEVTDAFIFACIESIWDSERVMKPGVDFSLEELTTFLDSCKQEVRDKIDDFFVELPKISLVTKAKCKKCSTEDTIVVNSLEDFFE